VIEHALGWARAGWSVFPIAAGAKYPPSIKDWQVEATTDEEQIRAWWAQWPDANIGGVCGDKWLVVDVDVRGGKPGLDSVSRLESDYEPLPRTRRHATPSGGYHLIYRKPSNWGETSKIADLPGYPAIDIQVGRAMVVLPPSTTAEGAYAVTDEHEPVPGPAWLVTVRRGDTGKGARSPVATIDNLGQLMHLRDNELYRLASLWRRQGWTYEATLDGLRHASVNRIYDDHRAKPERELERIAKSAFRHPSDLFDRISLVGNTDKDNADLLAVLSEGDLLWNEHRASWYWYDGGRWRSSGLAVRTLSADAIQALWSAWHQSTDDDQRKKIEKRIGTMSSSVGLRGVWDYLKGHVWTDSGDFDQDAELLNVGNGTVNLRTGELQPHAAGDRITKIANADYLPDADTAEWEKFVLTCCEDDAEMARFLKIAFGQAMVGRVDLQLFLFLYGTGANGKSQITEAVLRTIGDYGHSGTVDLLVNKGRDSVHTEDIAALEGRRLVVLPEVERGSHWASARVKGLTGGDSIAARHLYGPAYSFKPSHTLIISGNYQPEVRDRSYGFMRRMVLVPFTHIVPPDERIPDYGALLAGSGVLRWLIEGATEFLQMGTRQLPACARIESDTERYLTEGNQIARYVRDVLELDPEAWTSSADLYEQYEWWYKEQGETFKETQQALIQQLSLSYPIQYQLRQFSGRRVRGWRGLRVAAPVIPNRSVRNDDGTF
jgi:putative DNA primase/helicase